MIRDPAHARTMVETPAQPTPEGGQTKPSNPFFWGVLLERSLSRGIVLIHLGGRRQKAGKPTPEGGQKWSNYSYSPYVCAGARAGNKAHGQ